MMFPEHCDRTRNKYGDAYPEVHLWLDELWKYFGPAHRTFRHNKNGVKVVYKRWGRIAALVAIDHIRDDGEYCPDLGECLAKDPIFEED